MITESSSRFDEELSHCTVRIIAGDRIGSGFFVAARQVLTCAHVVGAASAGEISILWRGSSYPARVKQLNPNPVPADDNVYPDLAILEIDIKEHPVVLLDENFQIADPLYTFGYSDFQPNGVGTTAIIEGDARYGQSGDQRLLKFKDGQFRPGLSGSPLLNMRTERVCGILKRSRGSDSALGGEGITVTTLYWHFGFLREASDGGRGLILSGPERERGMMKVIQKIQAMDDDDDGWLDEFVYCAMPPLQSRRAATHYSAIVDECRKRGFVAMQLYDFPTYRSSSLDTVQRLIWRANLVIFDLTEEHPDVLYQLGYQDGIDVDDDAVLLVQQLPNVLRLNFPPFAIRPFSDEKKLCEIVGERLDRLLEELKTREQAAARRKEKNAKSNQRGKKTGTRKP